MEKSRLPGAGQQTEVGMSVKFLSARKLLAAAKEPGANIIEELKPQLFLGENAKHGTNKALTTTLIPQTGNHGLA